MAVITWIDLAAGDKPPPYELRCGSTHAGTAIRPRRTSRTRVLSDLRASTSSRNSNLTRPGPSSSELLHVRASEDVFGV
jgi:hypothetical protein